MTIITITLRITTIIKMKLIIMTPSIMTPSIMTLNITDLIEHSA
jgi:hypothetical protein